MISRKGQNFEQLIIPPDKTFRNHGGSIIFAGPKGCEPGDEDIHEEYQRSDKDMLNKYIIVYEQYQYNTEAEKVTTHFLNFLKHASDREQNSREEPT